MKLTVVLGASSEASFDILLNDNNFVRKWIKELQWSLDNCEFNQQEAFSSLLSLEESAEILVDACYTINKYLKNYIKIQDNILDQPQEYFNYLHSIFEKLSGEFGKPTRLFALANLELKTAIRNLNFFVHRLESKNLPNTSLYISFNKDQYRRKPLEELDYEFFEFSFSPGTLFLHYVELGKEYIDLYQDNLSLDYVGFKNLHYYSGEASLSFLEYDLFKDINFKNWLQSQGIDPYNKALGHGKIPLGTVIDINGTKNKIYKHKHIDKILIKK